MPRPVPIAPGADILSLTHERVTLRVPSPGRYKLAIRGQETFEAPHAGVFVLDFS